MCGPETSSLIAVAKGDWTGATSRCERRLWVASIVHSSLLARVAVAWNSRPYSRLLTLTEKKDRNSFLFFRSYDVVCFLWLVATVPPRPFYCHTVRNSESPNRHSSQSNSLLRLSSSTPDGELKHRLENPFRDASSTHLVSENPFREMLPRPCRDLASDDNQ